MPSLKLESCDTFVMIHDPVHGGQKEVVFGKNSDRPRGECQEVVYQPRRSNGDGATVQCTYIEIPDVKSTLAVILSKPAWMWGAEMGSNEAGVVIGNEAVWDRLNDPVRDLEPRLLGMDLLRLGLERGRTAADALDVITQLLQTHGQGGPCSDINETFTYHNSFLIADSTEAWVLETADRFWVAEKITVGTRNISNCMSIGSKIDRMHPDLKEMARKSGWWSGREEDSFNWREIITDDGEDKQAQVSSGSDRFKCGSRLLKLAETSGQISVQSMMKTLRDMKSGICRPFDDHAYANPTAGAQISLLKGSTHYHWFTATPNPHLSVFKPVPSFNFLSGSESTRTSAELSIRTQSLRSFPEKVQDTIKDRQHELWRIHLNSKSKTSQVGPFKALENELLKEILENSYMERAEKEGKNIFDDAVRKEIDLYLALEQNSYVIIDP